jgi:hypothetical protein
MRQPDDAKVAFKKHEINAAPQKTLVRLHKQ